MTYCITELCNMCEQRMISACIEDLALLNIDIEVGADTKNTAEIVKALFVFNEFPIFANAYKLWVGDMATALTENLSDVAPGGSISELYHMVAPGWEEMKCEYQLGYELRQHGSYLKHMTDLLELSIQLELSALARTLIYLPYTSSSVDDDEFFTDDDESPIGGILEVIQDRVKTEALEANPETWLLDSEGEPLWQISAQDRVDEVFRIRDFLYEIIKKSSDPKRIVDCAVVLNYLNRLPQSPVGNFTFEIMLHVNGEYVYAECIGDEFEMELSLNNNGESTSYGRFNQEGYHPGEYNSSAWVQAADELLGLEAVIKCDTDLDSVTWFDDVSELYWDRLE